VRTQFLLSRQVSLLSRQVSLHSRQVSLLSRQVSLLSRQVSLLGVRRVSLAPGIPASHTNPLPDSPSYPIGVRGQGGRGGAYCPPSLSPIMGRDGEKGDNPPSGSTTVTHSPWSCQQALSPSFCSHLATVQRLCSQGDKGQADF
jgi:hypothetical protein